GADRGDRGLRHRLRLVRGRGALAGAGAVAGRPRPDRHKGACAPARGRDRGGALPAGLSRPEGGKAAVMTGYDVAIESLPMQAVIDLKGKPDALAAWCGDV